jgi:TolB-like protein
VYKDQPADVRQIADELGEQYVLEGSLQAQDERLRIMAQLVDASTGDHVWSERSRRHSQHGRWPAASVVASSRKHSSV